MPHRAVEKQPDQKDYLVLERYWLVERTFGWFSHWCGPHRECAGSLDVVTGRLARAACLRAADALNNLA